MLAPLLEAGAWLNLSGEGSRDGSESGALGGSIGAHGQPREEARDSEAASQGLSGHGCSGGSVGEPPGSPHHCAGLSHKVLHGTATSAAMRCLFPGRGTSLGTA